MPHCCGPAVETTVLKVEGMSCGHCKNAVENALKALDGVQKAEVDLQSKKVTVTYTPGKVNLDAMKKAIEDAGYEVK
ncbi:copper chaperone CopZ [Calderihabitans maritimus]|uniref:Copper chaperone CopZ n=1 Tax=Calderihabitans maritimus TaxID=1246530 RepID=A0A1Z5HW44_9FIRM|nr:copper chaperone CopZ [Calderihabitans maritimus]GAW93734.1 copper ion binding protein [Calderihabitans maritimus]